MWFTRADLEGRCGLFVRSNKESPPSRLRAPRGPSSSLLICAPSADQPRGVSSSIRRGIVISAATLRAHRVASVRSNGRLRLTGASRVDTIDRRDARRE